MLTKLTPLSLYAVREPKDAVCHILPNEIIYRDSKNEDNWVYIPLPDGVWQIVGEVTKDEMSFDPLDFLEKNYCQQQYSYIEIILLRNYIKNDWEFITSKESFYSLLAANGVHFVNPIKKPNNYNTLNPAAIPYFSETMAEWQSYESNLVDKVVILKKV